VQVGVMACKAAMQHPLQYNSVWFQRVHSETFGNNR